MNIGFAGSKDTTYDCIKAILDAGYKVENLITLTPKQGKHFIVSGYYNLSGFAKEKDIAVYNPEKYSLKCQEDQQAILSLNLDILFIIGWQRLIPEWLLNSLGVGAFGMHGSSEPLPRGRGRSPLNWSIIEGKTRFITNLFKYDSGVDSGGIVDKQIFDITLYDTCETLHFKNMICMKGLLLKHLPSMLQGNLRTRCQSGIEATYYPKRKPKDGLIDWTLSAETISRLIRAVTKPFPGAFTFARNDKMIVWEAIPFDYHIRYDDVLSGTVVEKFLNGKFVVKCGKGSLLVHRWELKDNEKIRVGIRLHNNGLKITSFMVGKYGGYDLTEEELEDKAEV